MTDANANDVKRFTGLLVIEVVNSNPNGDPDRESDPRQRPDGRGEISPVSFKRKVRDLIEAKDGTVWQVMRTDMNLNGEKFAILESRGRDRKTIEGELKNGSFQDKYWDGRVFGNTFLEEGSADTIKTGVVQFGLGLSVAPIEISRHTNTNKAGVQEGKDRGMAPMGYRFVPHGVYCMPFFVNPSMAHKSGCTQQDIDLLFKVIPHAYAHTRSHARPLVDLRHAWVVEHKSVLGSCSDFAIIEALTPKKNGNSDSPSNAWADYIVPTELPDELAARVAKIRDLMEE
ncbi:MAG: type I CRISPR-associated protein Cas7 [Gemmatimonadota bacterium]|nr:type I CRISPR-associated protein Cas7 [Candidatus Poribacteria bacterium]MDE2797481.1 type I CRISPR-associated protein Cas7 [Gemmatimonadota bacterium]